MKNLLYVKSKLLLSIHLELEKSYSLIFPDLYFSPMLLLQILAATCPGIVDVKLGRLVRTRNKFVSPTFQCSAAGWKCDAHISRGRLDFTRIKG